MSLYREQVVAELLAAGGKVSRNRDFDLFAGPGGKGLHRLYRHYAALKRELARAAAGEDWEVAAHRENGGLVIEMHNLGLCYCRVARVPKPLVGHFAGVLDELGLDLKG